MINDISIIMAFGAGLVSFLSPCVLPLVPGYVSFIFDKKGALIGKALGPRDWDSRKSVRLFEFLINSYLPQSAK